MSLFKTNYGYNPVTSLTLRQAKKLSKTAKERVEKLMTLHKELYKSAKMVLKNEIVLWQEKIWETRF